MVISSLKIWGNSHAIRIPQILVETMNLKSNDKITLDENEIKGAIVIRKANKRKNIIELFKDYKENYIPEKIDWGEDVGEEIW